MAIRFALLLSLVLWSCGDDEDPPPVVPQDTVLRPSGELQPWDLAPIVPVDSVRAMPVGTPVYIRTEFANGELADLEMTFVRVVDDFLPPMPVYMVEASDPVLIQLGGIAQGMSGSPIFTEQGTWAAIAYGFGSQDSPPYYFFATPIEWVIGSRGTVPLAKPAATWEGTRIVPLEVPLLSTGRDFNPPPDGSSTFLNEAISAGLTQERQESFEAGRPLAVGLLLGELTLGALGTVSYLDGDRVYGFGHPFESLGPVELPIIEAKVLGEISSVFIPFKFATLNPTVRGILTEDRLPGVRGVLEEEPQLVPIRSRYTFPSGSELELTHSMPAVGLVPFLSVSLLSNAVFAPLPHRIENDPDHSIRVTTDISFVETDSTLVRTRLYADPEGRLLDLVYAASGDLSSALSELMTRDDRALQVGSAEVRVEMVPEPRFAVVAEVAADTVISLGSDLAITTSLRVGRRNDRDIELALGVPDTLPPGIYQLEVGPAAALGDGPGGGGDPSFGFFGPGGDFGGDESLEDVFARVNGPDRNVVLKARLTFQMPSVEVESPPPGSGEGSEGESGEGSGDESGEGSGDGSDDGARVGPGGPGFFSGFLPEPAGPPPTVSVEEEVDLVLQGTQTLSIEVKGG